MKIYLIGMLSSKDDIDVVQSIVKATTSYESAKQEILDIIEHHKADKSYHNFYSAETVTGVEWLMRYTIDSGRVIEFTYAIREINLIDSDAVPEIRRPELEKRCEALEKHNDELKEEIADLMRRKSAAECYLTFYDGGVYESFDRVLKNAHTARAILMDKEKGNTLIGKLFEEWLEQRKER